MKMFTYNDYLKCLEVLKKNKSGEYALKEPVKDDELKVEEEKQQVNNKHDKTFKIILENKEEASNFINKALDFKEKIKTEDLEKYTCNFITKNFKSQETDIIYKLKNKKVFILIEQQTKVDYSMAYRILNYQIEIMRSCIEKKKVKNKEYEHALVIAIVLYTGPRKWTAKTHIREMQEKLDNYNTYPILGNYGNIGNYNIIDINNYTKKDLLKSESLLSKILILEKSKTKEELLKNLYEIIPKIREENRETLARIINYTYKNYFDSETIEEIIGIIKKEGVGNMLASVEMLEKERRRDIKKGIKIGEIRGEARGEKRGEARGREEGMKTGRKKEKVSLAKKMLKENFAIEIIEKITGLRREKFM